MTAEASFPGLRITMAEYRQIEAVNVSTLLALLLSPKHYQHERQNGRADADHFRVGRAAHTAIFEPMQFLEEYALSRFKDWRTKKARAWRTEQEAAGRTVLTPAQYATARRICDAVLAHPTAAACLSGGRPEWTLVWTDSETGIPCKGRLDYISDVIGDLKTTRHATPRLFGIEAASYHYHTRLAWYQDAFELLSGRRLPAVIVAAQSELPHDVAVYDLTPEQLASGRRTYRTLLTRLAETLASNAWPGVCPDRMELRLPAWAIGDVTETGEPLTIDGMPFSIGDDEL